MNNSIKKYLISKIETVKTALEQLNVLGIDAILFVVDDQNKLLGSLTDGDVRRGLIAGLNTESFVTEFIQEQPKSIDSNLFDLTKIISLRERGFKIVPMVDNGVVVDVLNFREQRSFLPIDAVIMAGGKGTRLLPLTATIPKPLLEVGGKPIIEYNVNRLAYFGLKNQFISINYLGEQLQNYFGDGSDRSLQIKYISEDKPLGTFGALASVVDQINNDYVLVMNSDLLTNIDFEEFYLDFIESGADLAVATIPYEVNIPYAVMETNNNQVLSFQEKPTYTYYSNGGIYLMKKEVLNLVPKDSFYNATDLMDELIRAEKKVQSFPILGYWLDVGKHEDFKKAQEDIKHLKL
jgi:dTDP-glucose pyrophosphorylase